MASELGKRFSFLFHSKMASHERFLLLCFIIISIIERNYSWYVQNNHVQQMRREVFQVFARRWGSKAAPTSKSSVDVIMNDGINAHTVRLLLPNTEPGKSDQMIGIFPLEEAMAKALELDTDLVLINDKADPPICKLINSGKFKYLVEKKKKDSSKKQIKSETKELKLSLSIDDHDFEVRIKAARKFIEEGDSVSILFCISISV